VKETMNSEFPTDTPVFSVPADLEAELDELVTHYPQKRSAALMFLHAIQERFGCVSSEAMEWTARKLDLQPINIYELVTFYPMFRQQPMGRYQIKICRTGERFHQGRLSLQGANCVAVWNKSVVFKLAFHGCFCSCYSQSCHLS